MLYFVGLGLGDAKDITVKGLEVVRVAHKVYLEHYTSILTVGKEELEKFYGREVILADRELVEQGVEEVLDLAKDEEIAFLVVGDPFGATTHADLVLRYDILIYFLVILVNEIFCSDVGRRTFHTELFTTQA